MTLTDTLAQLSFSNRNPSWEEYIKSSPADQRAIVARWKEIIGGKIIDVEAFAKTNFKLALAYNGAAEWPARKSASMPETSRARDDIQWDYDMCGSRRNYEWGDDGDTQEIRKLGE